MFRSRILLKWLLLIVLALFLLTTVVACQDSTINPNFKNEKDEGDADKEEEDPGENETGGEGGGNMSSKQMIQQVYDLS